ncbi:hypothetical protein B0T22DRAFT_482677 [Podospora appendiculata]|uniref:Uncharacterized protein n=1 Tax=Podospora appendiculata TaxID=314037 RepID=A0AAE1CAL8_9PEZI|nr:hypothetical protein B0T22DRAFT_482677 [Podospora appendiculata]
MACVVQIPGLDVRPTRDDLEKCRQIYNKLPSDDAQPAIREEHLQQLAGLFVEHNAHEVFGIHLAHGHFNIEDGNVLVGEDNAEPLCRWTKPTATGSLDLDNLYGHTFILTDKGFRPYEYLIGAPPSLAGLGHDFLPQLAAFLQENNLTGVLALEVLMQPSPSKMSEFVLGSRGTIMLESSRLRNCTPSRRTGWAFTANDGTPRVHDGGTQEHVPSSKGHVTVIIEEKKIESCKDALGVLQEYGLLS